MLETPSWRAKESHTSGCRKVYSSQFTAESSYGRMDTTVDLSSSSQTTASSPSDLMNAISQLEGKLTKSIQEALGKALAPVQKLINDEVATLSRQVIELTQRIEKLESQLAVNGSSLTEESTKSPEISVLESQVKLLSNAVRDHSRKAEFEEREVKKSSVVISGLDEDASENTAEVINNFIASKLDISDAQLISANRIGKQQHNKGCLIKVQFESPQAKREIMERKNVLKGSGVFINHDLTKEQQQRNKKLRDARKLAIQRYAPQKVTISKGKICVDGRPLTAESFQSLCTSA